VLTLIFSHRLMLVYLVVYLLGFLIGSQTERCLVMLLRTLNYIRDSDWSRGISSLVLMSITERAGQDVYDSDIFPLLHLSIYIVLHRILHGDESYYNFLK